MTKYQDAEKSFQRNNLNKNLNKNLEIISLIQIKWLTQGKSPYFKNI